MRKHHKNFLHFTLLFSINGPFAAFAAYLSEFHCAKYRARIMILRGLMVHSANLMIPLLAWAVFPLDLEYSFFAGKFGK